MNLELSSNLPSRLTTALQPRIGLGVPLVKGQGHVRGVVVVEECQVGAPERQFVRICQRSALFIRNQSNSLKYPRSHDVNCIFGNRSKY